MADVGVKQTQFHQLLDLTLLVYMASGLYAGVRFIDDWMELRLLILAFAGLPLGILYLAAGRLYPGWSARWPRLRWLSAAALVLSFAPGYLLWINAGAAHPGVVKRTISTESGIAVRDVRRGGLGILYLERW